MLKLSGLEAELHHLVLDFNGTLACDGVLLPGVAERLRSLGEVLHVHVVTGDTFGTAARQLEGLPCDLHVLQPHRQAEAKESFVRELGAHATACIGNGRNDRLMMAAARLGIAVLQREGAWSETILAAQIVTTDINAAFDLLLVQERLHATTRP